MPNSAVCIVSGGLDSICTCAYLQEKGYEIRMISFVYGQRAKREVAVARHFARVMKAADHRIIDISFMKSLYGSSNMLTHGRQDLPENFDQSLVVPIRNAVFVAVAGAWAMSIGTEMVAYGAHKGDISHYPDCRPEFAKAIANALNLGESDGIDSGKRRAITVWSPAVDGIDKPELLRIGHRIMGDKIFKTWSCYSNGISSGKAAVHCGKCESCISRKNAFISAGIEDKTGYATKGR